MLKKQQRKADAESQSNQRARRPKMRSATSAPAVNTPKARSGWSRGNILSSIAILVTLCVAVATTYSNHRFGEEQATLTQRYAAYPKLQADLLALEGALKACSASEEMIVQPGTPRSAGTTSQQEEWFQQHIVEPVMTASDRLSQDSEVLVNQMSSSVRGIVQETQKSQVLSRNFCIHYTGVLMRHVDQGDFGTPAADQIAGKEGVMKMVTFLEAQGQKLNAQITEEIGSD